MRHAILLILLCAACVSCGDEGPTGPPPDDAGPKGRVVARISGIQSDGGTILARLYHGGAGFPSDAEAAYRRETVEIRDGKATVAFEDVPYGEYAIWICHDEDGDGELKTNILGMPKEGVGVSGPPPSFAPSYGDARFAHDGALSEHDIALRYL